MTADIAVRRAELLRLTREERAALGDRKMDWKLFLTLHTAMGLLFGAALTLASASVAALVSLLLLEPGEAMPLLRSVPWWRIFLLSSVLFGAGMGAVTAALGRR